MEKRLYQFELTALEHSMLCTLVLGARVAECKDLASAEALIEDFEELHLSVDSLLYCKARSESRRDLYDALYLSLNKFSEVSVTQSDPPAPVDGEAACVTAASPEQTPELETGCSDCFFAQPDGIADYECLNPASPYHLECVGDSSLCGEFVARGVLEGRAVVCATCRYACPDEPGVLCVNSNSPYCGQRVNEPLSCDEWVQRPAPPGTVPCG